MRKLIKKVVEDKAIGSTEQVYGWVHAIKELGQQTFLNIKDRSGELQLMVPKNSQFLTARSINIGDVVLVKGIAKEDKRAPGGVEMSPTELEVIAACLQPPPLPLDRLEYRVSASLEKRLDFRYLDLRNERVERIFKIKSEVLRGLRKAIENREFVEINTPKIIKAGAEGGTTLFPIEYFEKDAFLSQSPQFYKQMMMASGLERVYEIAPAFRAERHNTPRHLNEFISVDLEMSFVKSEEDVMRLEEEIIREATIEIKKASEEIGLKERVEVPKIPFPRITFDEARSLLRARNVIIEEDEDMNNEGEEALSDHFEKEEDNEFFFITQFPKAARPLYLKPIEEMPNRTKSFDLIFKGMEITSGGQRINDYKELTSAFKERKIPTKDYSFYLDAFKYGMPPHGGFGFGLDRYVARLVGEKNVREATLFPRDMNRLIP